MKLFKNTELRDLIIAIIILSVIFSYPDFSAFFLVSIVMVFFSYIIRELAHKFVARKFGCMSTFKLWPPGILIGVMSVLLKQFVDYFADKNIVFAAPGFAEIVPYRFGRMGFKVARVTPKDIGIVALAGTGLNVAFAVLFKMFPQGIFQTLGLYNGLIALFNLIPISPLDGSKIFLWSMFTWIFLVFVSVLVVFVF
jgi:Zn-dependent protease